MQVLNMTFLSFSDYECLEVSRWSVRSWRKHRRDGRPGGFWGNGRPISVLFAPQRPSAAQSSGSVRDVRHVPDLQTPPALLPHRLLHSRVSALRMAGPDWTGPDQQEHADHQPRRQTPAVRTGKRLPEHRPDDGADAGRLLRPFLSALPQTTARDGIEQLHTALNRFSTVQSRYIHWRSTMTWDI